MWNPIFTKDLNLKPNIHKRPDLKFNICEYKFDSMDKKTFPEKEFPQEFKI